MASSFNQAPTDYDKIRPGYPEGLFLDLIDLTGIPDRGKILEIGCGTGQATAPLINKGYRFTCLDIGEKLLEIARKKFRDTDAKFELTSFEEWTPDSKYDVVLSATAWHWINQKIGYRKASEVLFDTGSIALFWNKYPTPYTGFFEHVQKIYDRIKPLKRTQVQSTSEWIKEQRDSLLDSGYFSDLNIREYHWSIRFSSEEYITLLNTFSDHRALQVEKRRELFTGISQLIDSDYGGYVIRPYVSVLFTAQKYSRK